MNDIIQKQIYKDFKKMSGCRERRIKKKEYYDYSGFEVKPARRPKMSNYRHEESAKMCRRCLRSFPVTAEYFYRNRQNIDGLHSYCKECKREINNT